MAHCNKDIKIKEEPKGRSISHSKDPEAFYQEHPCWAFNSADNEKWSIFDTHTREDFWSIIIPKLQNFETQTWSEIFVAAKKMNHPTDLDRINKVARDRLDELKIEAESLYSLRLGSKLRLYGFMNDKVFNIIWYDNDHGDHTRCVCRSRKKHT